MTPSALPLPEREIQVTSSSRKQTVPCVLILMAISLGAAWGGSFNLPLTQTNGWQVLHYRRIPANTIRNTVAGLEIDVTNSASPIVFPLLRGLSVVELRAEGSIAGSLKIPPGRQGQKGFDDYTMRVGLVGTGARTLSWSEGLSSPDWVKHLFALAPKGTGIGKIHFFNVGTDVSQIGYSHPHYLSNLMEETVVVVPDSEGRFAFTHRFAKPMPVIAVWIASDGDDTKSSFAVTLTRLELVTVDD